MRYRVVVMLWAGMLGLLWPAVAFGQETYVVQPGDTIGQLAQDHLGSTRRWAEIAALNDLKPPYQVEPGQELTMPLRSLEASAGPPGTGSGGFFSPPGTPPDPNEILFERLMTIGGVPMVVAVLAVGIVLHFAYSTFALKLACMVLSVTASTKRCLVYVFPIQPVALLAPFPILLIEPIPVVARLALVVILALVSVLVATKYVFDIKWLVALGLLLVWMILGIIFGVVTESIVGIVMGATLPGFPYGGGMAGG